VVQQMEREEEEQIALQHKHSQPPVEYWYYRLLLEFARQKLKLGTAKYMGREACPALLTLIRRSCHV
jgi:hypothetical protein